MEALTRGIDMLGIDMLGIITPGIGTRAIAPARIVMRKHAAREQKSIDMNRPVGIARTGRSVQNVNAAANVTKTSVVPNVIAPTTGPKPGSAAPLAIERAALGVFSVRGT